MSVFDSIGTLFEGGLFARALEPKTGEGQKQKGPEKPFEGTCLNCGAERVGQHCHRCGQKAHIHKTMREFLHDLVHGALHFDGKVWRTLPLLAWRPGKLTRRYIDGERARFVSPMALFLFSVFLMFAVFQLAGITPPSDLGSPVQYGSGDGAKDEARQDLTELEKARAAMDAGNPAAPILDSQIEAIERDLAKPAEVEDDGKVVLAETGDGDQVVTYNSAGLSLFEHGIAKWRENPSLMAYKLQSNFYKFSWLLIPLSLPFVWLLFFWKRRFGMYDHAVFVTYSLSFMTLFYVVLVLLGGIGVASPVLALLGVFVPVLHIYKQVKGTYELRRFSALWRTFVLVVFVIVILSLFVNVLLVIGALG